MFTYAYIADGVLVQRFEQAYHIMAPWPRESGEFDNGVDLDDFYIAAHMGVDHETGEVVDRQREIIATAREGIYYPFLISLYTGDWS